MSFDGSGNMGNQSGKSGGDVGGGSLSDSSAAGGAGDGSGSAWVQNVDPIATGVGVGGGAFSGAGSAQLGGDVTDNTSMGNINISS